MKVPRGSSLGGIRLSGIIVPTITKEFDGCEIVLEMEDGTVAHYENEGSVELKSKYDSLQQAAKIWYPFDDTLNTFNQYHIKDSNILKFIKVKFSNVKAVYISEL